MRFERLGVFAFSPEDGTEAASMDGAVPSELAVQRQKRLMELQLPIAEEYHRSLVGTSLEVLVEAILLKCYFQKLANFLMEEEEVNLIQFQVEMKYFFVYLKKD